MKKTKPKIVEITGAHFRLGWQESPNSSIDRSLVRYYPFPVAHDRIETLAKMNAFLGQISPAEKIPTSEGKFERVGRTRSGLYYLLQIVDSPVALKEVDFSRIGRNIIMDRRLCEREVKDVLHYLNSVYHLR